MKKLLTLTLTLTLLAPVAHASSPMGFHPADLHGNQWNQAMQERTTPDAGGPVQRQAVPGPLTQQAQAQAAAAQQQADMMAQQMQQMQAQQAQTQQQMMQQMQQMQADMAQQQAASAQQIQAALAAQAAPAPAPAPVQAGGGGSGDFGISAAQQIAIANHIPVDVLVRETAMGQIQTQLDNVRAAVVRARGAMIQTFDYAGCDGRGNHCIGPRRVAAFRHRADAFFQPFDDAADEMYTALTMAMALGVDVSDILMMLGGTCQQWGQYMCLQGQHLRFASCGWTGASRDSQCQCRENFPNNVNLPPCPPNQQQNGRIIPPSQGGCQLLRLMTDGAQIQQNWIFPEQQGGRRVECSQDQVRQVHPAGHPQAGQRVFDCHYVSSSIAGQAGRYFRNDINVGSSIQVACASDAIHAHGLLGRRNRRTANLISADVIQMLINADAPRTLAGNQDFQSLAIFCTPTMSEFHILQRTVQTGQLQDRLCIRRDLLIDRRDGSPRTNDRDLGSIRSIPRSPTAESPPETYTPEQRETFWRNIATAANRALSQKEDELAEARLAAPVEGEPVPERIAGAVQCDLDALDDHVLVIHPAFALCSVHAYNIGLGVNPGARGQGPRDRELMLETISLKTTVITQQMFRQFELLDSTVRRFETQLNRSMMATRLEAAGGQAGSGQQQQGTGGITRGIANARDCSSIFDIHQQMQCLQDNANLIRGEQNRGNAQHQVETDLAVIRRQRDLSEQHSTALGNYCEQWSPGFNPAQCANAIGGAANDIARRARMAEEDARRR
ncbi:MAG: hypothetical protein FWC83_01260 [Alphaproteobacteria bacterium]|nr:hypothetical protein [Alphaproteobacteria bacterium]